jgi:hypothetical protein
MCGSVSARMRECARKAAMASIVPLTSSSSGKSKPMIVWLDTNSSGRSVGSRSRPRNLGRITIEYGLRTVSSWAREGGLKERMSRSSA